MFPRGSFVRIARNVLASSPRALLRANGFGAVASRADRLGFEFVRAHMEWQRVGKADFRFERPFTTPARLARFLDKAANMPGTVKARKALKHLVAGSASPMETTMAMLLCLPLGMGGVRASPTAYEPRREPSRAIEARSR